MKTRFVFVVILLILNGIISPTAEASPTLTVRGEIAKIFGDLGDYEVIISIDQNSFNAEILPDRTYSVTLPNQGSFNAGQEITISLRNKKEDRIVCNALHILTEKEVLDMSVMVNIEPLIPAIKKRLKAATWGKIKKG